jgi:hypothetical protein
VQRVAPDATAFAYRNSDFAPMMAGFWNDPSEADANLTWVREFSDALRPLGAGGGYINFMDADDSPRTADNYGQNWARLRQVKAKWDPDNVFHINQNIPPALTVDDARQPSPASDRSREDASH